MAFLGFFSLKWIVFHSPFHTVSHGINLIEGCFYTVHIFLFWNTATHNCLEFSRFTLYPTGSGSREWSLLHCTRRRGRPAELPGTIADLRELRKGEEKRWRKSRIGEWSASCRKQQKVKKNSCENRALETKLPIHPVICGKPQQQKVREEEEELWEVGKCAAHTDLRRESLLPRVSSKYLRDEENWLRRISAQNLEENCHTKPSRNKPIRKYLRGKVQGRCWISTVRAEKREREREREREHKKKIGSSRRDDAMHRNPANKNKKPHGTHDAMCGNPAKNKKADPYSLPPISSSTFSWQNCYLLPLTHPPSLLLPLFLASLTMGAVLCTFLAYSLSLSFLLLPLFLTSLMTGAVLCTFLPCSLSLSFLRVVLLLG